MRRNQDKSSLMYEEGDGYSYTDRWIVFWKGETWKIGHRPMIAEIVMGSQIVAFVHDRWHQKVLGSDLFSRVALMMMSRFNPDAPFLLVDIHERKGLGWSTMRIAARDRNMFSMRDKTMHLISASEVARLLFFYSLRGRKE